jgi:L-rhamnonate dehydratase
MTRREMIAQTYAARLPLGAPATAAALPQAFPGESPKLKISALQFVRLEGTWETQPGKDHQFQVNPLHVYDAFRPPEYHDNPAATTAKAHISALYLRLLADSGLYGLYGPVDREAAVVVDQQLRPFLIGKDPLAGEALWDQMFRSNRHSRAGHFLMAISAVDNALWDLRGRLFNVPVWRLLGGPTRPSVEVYASCLGFSIEPGQAAQKAVQLKAGGYRNQKWFLAAGPGDGPAGLRRNVALVAALREAVGPDVELMFDAYQGWSLDYAIAWAKQVEPYRPRWIEEAFPADQIETFAALRRATSIPVASGEHIYGRWEAHRYLQAGALSVIQADPEWCGGVSELRRICTVASLFNAPVIPHGHSLHAALHTIAAQSPAVCPVAEFLITKMRSYYHFEKQPPMPVDARVALPVRPGFGIEFDPARIEKQAVVRWTEG